MLKGRIVRTENDELAAELLEGEEIWGEIVIDEEADGRMRLIIDPEAEIDFDFDYDEFGKIVGKTAERLWKMHQEQPERPARVEEDEDDDDAETDNAVEADSTADENSEQEPKAE
ncbi:hypothetical protein LJC48_04775 [Desulfovibrio sp. OttesenSCG-928-C06]|nr:hypothetical protein [Desulfovibrio sp. OttesenSCG-928-C06]